MVTTKDRWFNKEKGADSREKNRRKGEEVDMVAVLVQRKEEHRLFIRDREEKKPTLML